VAPLEDSEAFRFLWLRSFHNAIAVRISRRGDFYGLEAVILDRAGRFSANYRRWLFGGSGDHRPGNVSRRVTKELSPDQGRALIARLEQMQFWQMATRGHALPGTDGARWILEARREGRYHVVDRWSDNDDGIKSVGMLFLDLAGLADVGPVY
jgi:hypothetical protein